MPNAISLLREDHQRISGLFDLFMSSGRLSEELILFQQIKEEIELHLLLEEKVFYPALSKYYELSDVLDSSYEEHDEMGDVLEEIDQMEFEGEDLEETGQPVDEILEGEVGEPSASYRERYADSVGELRLMFQRHIDQEEREVFPEARDLLEPEELEAMAGEMNELRGMRMVA